MKKKMEKLHDTFLNVPLYLKAAMASLNKWVQNIFLVMKHLKYTEMQQCSIGKQAQISFV